MNDLEIAAQKMASHPKCPEGLKETELDGKPVPDLRHPENGGFIYADLVRTHGVKLAPYVMYDHCNGGYYMKGVKKVYPTRKHYPHAAALAWLEVNNA